ncbi:MAG: hypothetical protein WCV82_00485 [Candidatus Paceibacterota bacterium]
MPKSSQKKALPTPTIMVSRETTGEVVFKIHLSSPDCGGFRINVRNIIANVSIWPAEKNSFPVKDGSLDIPAVYLMNLKGSFAEAFEGRYVVEVIAFNGEKYRDSLPARAEFALSADEAKVLRELSPATEATPVAVVAPTAAAAPVAEVVPAVPVVETPSAPLAAPLATIGEIMDAGRGDRASGPDITIEKPDIQLRGLNLSIRVDPVTTKFLEVVGVDKDGNQVFPLDKHEVGSARYITGHLRKLNPVAGLLKTGTITIKATALGNDGKRSETVEHQLVLTDHYVAEIKPQEPRVRQHADPRDEVEQPPAAQPSKATPPPSAPSTEPATPPPAPRPPSRMDLVLSRIAILATQESVDQLGEAVAGGTELLSGKADKVITGVGNVQTSVDGLKKQGETMIGGLKEIENKVAELANKPGPKPSPEVPSSQPAKTPSSRDSNVTAWLVILAIVAVVALSAFFLFARATQSAQTVRSSSDDPALKAGQAAIMDSLNRLRIDQEELQRKHLQPPPLPPGATPPVYGNDSLPLQKAVESKPPAPVCDPEPRPHHQQPQKVEVTVNIEQKVTPPPPEPKVALQYREPQVTEEVIQEVVYEEAYEAPQPAAYYGGYTGGYYSSSPMIVGSVGVQYGWGNSGYGYRYSPGHHRGYSYPQHSRHGGNSYRGYTPRHSPPRQPTIQPRGGPSRSAPGRNNGPASHNGGRRSNGRGP